MSRIRKLCLGLQASLWFVPTVVVSGCIGLALVLIDLQTRIDVNLARVWPRLFGAGSDGARSMLSAIATSMITVAGVVFSITIVALSQASSQYSPRVLRNFMSDRPTQVVLGVFVGIFAYCLVVLRTIRSSSDEGGAFLPSLAVLGGVLLALFGVAMLIYFIHHVASAIQVSSILDRIAHDTSEAIDRLFPQPIGKPLLPEEEHPSSELPHLWHPIAARESGYLVGVNDDGLLQFAAKHERVLRLAHCIGDFVVAGQLIARISGNMPLAEADERALGRLFTMDRQRTVHQDALYGMRQIVDVAVKALSPGINDPTTAMMCIDHLCALLVRLAGRHIPGPCRSDDRALRVVAIAPDFERMAALFDIIVEHAAGDTAVLERLLNALDILRRSTDAPPRLQSLLRRTVLLEDSIARSVTLPARRIPLLKQARMLSRRLGSAG
jgi:uncharacterized membrane protein